MKKIISFIIILAMLSTMVLSLSSCDLADWINILQDFDRFEIDLNITINEDYVSEIVPEEFDLTIGGVIRGESCYLYLDESLKIFFDLLLATDVISVNEKILLESFIEYDDGSFFCVEINDINLYIQPFGNRFAIQRKGLRSYGNPDNPDVVSEFSPDKVYHFSDIKTKIEKELLKYPGYRYSELYIVMETIETDENNENNGNFLNILAIRENGKAEILEKVKLDCDLSEVRENSELLYTGNIIPMRYIMELLGETVGWDDENKKAYIIIDDKNIYFEETSLLNSKTYTNLLQIMTKTDFVLNSAVADEYIEFKITRK